MQIKKVRPNAIVPTYGTEGAAGFDLYSTVDIMLDPGDRALIPTGLVFNINPGFEVQVRPRSGMALKHGVTVLNSPGTIDADFTGEVQVILINHSKQTFKVQEGDRVAQGVLAPVCGQVKFEVVDEITKETKRGAGGFGHTGTSLSTNLTTEQSTSMPDGTSLLASLDVVHSSKSEVKSGTQVKVLKELYSHGFDIGDTVTCIDIDTTNENIPYLFENAKGIDWWLSKEEFEVIKY